MPKISKMFGRNDSDLRGIWSRRVMCYIRLRDKKNAEKCLKKLKQFGDRAPFLTKKVKKMKHKPIEVVKTKKAKGKCSNPYCEKVESKAGEFSICSRCERAKYCGRKCQKAHYKFHKKFCSKDLKKSAN